MNTIYTQKKSPNQIKLQLEESEVIYSAKLGSTEFTRNIPYTSISTDTAVFVESNDWYRNAGLLWTIIGLFQVFSLIQSRRVGFPFWLFLGIGCLVAYFYKQTKFTVIDAEGKNILIIKDKDHDSIFSAIFEKRKEFYKKAYGEIDFDNDPEDELSKFEFLKKKLVLTEEEFNVAKEKIEAHSKSKPMPSTYFGK